MTYGQAANIFATAKNKALGKPIGHNTRLIKIADAYGIMYHNTVVVYIYSNGHYELNNGGWNTSTTKLRMNEYSPISIFSVKGEWYARYKNETIPYFNHLTTNEWGT